MLWWMFSWHDMFIIVHKTKIVAILSQTKKCSWSEPPSVSQICRFWDFKLLPPMFLWHDNHTSMSRKRFFLSPQNIIVSATKSCYMSSRRSLNMTWCSSCDHQQICLLILEEHTWSVIHLLMCPAVHIYEKEYFWAKTWLPGWYHSLQFHQLKFCVFVRYFLYLNVKLDGDGLFFKQTMMNKAS